MSLFCADHREVFSSSTHLWCKWHIFNDALEELGPVYRVNGPFGREFHYVINQMLTEDEFERAWDYLFECYKLRENKWLQNVYKKKNMWGKPWCKDIYCARMASTQRSESANSILKKVIPRNFSMNMFVQQYIKMLFIRSAAEDIAEHKTKQVKYPPCRMHVFTHYNNAIMYSCILHNSIIDVVCPPREKSLRH
jgi:hypothetical protein